MIRKLRLKFIAVIMALVLVLLGVIFGLIVHFTRLELERESVTMMQNIASILIFHLLKLKLIQTPSLSLILSYLNLYALQHTGYGRYAVSGPRRACFDPFIWAHRAISFRVLNVRVSSSA